jgi:general stress protein 26
MSVFCRLSFCRNSILYLQGYAKAMTEHQASHHQKVYTFLQHHPMGILSTVSSHGKPWGSAIYYVADEDFNLFFVTRIETFKYQNLEKHPFAALTVADSETQTTVQVAGEISRVPVQDYMDIIFEKLAKIRPEGDYAWTPPLDKIHKGNYMPLKLTPTKLQYADYGLRKSDVHTDYIQTIIPA